MLLDEKLKLLREQQGLSITELSKRINIAKSCLHRIENSQVKVSLLTLRKLSDYFNIPPAVLTSEYSLEDVEIIMIARGFQKAGITKEAFIRRFLTEKTEKEPTTNSRLTH